MSKPSASRKFPAGWVVAGCIAAVAVLAALGIAGSARLRSHDGIATAKPDAVASVKTRALSAERWGRVEASLGTLPLAFEANQGQTNPQVKYMARGSGYTVFLTANDAMFAMSSQISPSHPSGRLGLSGASRRAARVGKQTTAAIYMKPVGGNLHPQIAADRELPGRTNYFIGSDRSKWQQGVKQYATVSYRDVYPGVDMAFHGQQRQLEFDFIVAPGANPDRITMGFSGARKLSIDASGNLLLSSVAGDVVLHKPVAYQEKDGKRELVEAAFDVKSKREAAFSLGAYDHQRELVIDPSLSYATYVGGSAEDEVFGIALDGSGNAYVTGQTKSPSFPLTGGKPAGPTFNVFVTKVNSNGTAFGYTDIFAATGVGGNCSASGTGSCSGNAIAVDSAGNAYVAGTATAGFPTLPGLQTTFGGGGTDGFVLKVNSSGTLVYSTYLGGSGTDNANAIAIDSAGNAYIGGETDSTNFPIVSPAIQGSNAGTDDAFISKINTTGTTLVYSTYLGGSAGDLVTGIALDSSNNAYVTGITVSSDFPTTSGAFQTAQSGTVDNGFVTEIKADGSAKIYSTYLGGSGLNDALGVAVDPAGEAYITGTTGSSNFPTTNAAQTSNAGSSDVFVTKLNATGTGLVFSTYYGGTLDDVGTGIALDSFGDAYVTGKTTSSNYPVGGAFQSSLSGTSDAFVTEFSNTGFVVYSSFLGGTGTENELPGAGSQAGSGAIAVDSSSNAYVAGATASTTGFPTSAGAAQANSGGGLADGFVAKVGAAPADFSVAVSPATASTTSGQTTSAVTVTVSSVNSSYGQAVALSCGALPSKAVCHYSSGSVTPGSSAVTSSLTIATNGASSSSLLAPSTNRGMGVLYAMFLPIGGIALLGVRNNSRRKRLFGFLLLGVLLMGLLVLPACGGGSGGGGGGNNTPPGTYHISVSGQGGGATHSASLTLTVN